MHSAIRLLSVVEAAIGALADRNAARSPILKNSASSPPLLATVEPRLRSAQDSIEFSNPGKARMDSTIKSRNHDPSAGAQLKTGLRNDGFSHYGATIARSSIGEYDEPPDIDRGCRCKCRTSLAQSSCQRPDFTEDEECRLRTWT